MLFHSRESWTNLGLVVIRVGIGIAFMVHGYPKITGGEEVWTKLGGVMGQLGLDFWPVFWGFMAAFAEFVGGAMLIIGLLTRPFALLMAFTMFIAMINHLVLKGEGFNQYSHAMEAMIVFIAIILLGAGKWSIDHFLSRKS